LFGKQAEPAEFTFPPVLMPPHGVGAERAFVKETDGEDLISVDGTDVRHQVFEPVFLVPDAQLILRHELD